MATDQDSFKVYLPPADAAKLRAIAREEDRPIAGLIRLAVAAYLAAREERAAA
jgi:hypothetical protein